MACPALICNLISVMTFFAMSTFLLQLRGGVTPVCRLRQGVQTCFRMQPRIGLIYGKSVAAERSGPGCGARFQTNPAPLKSTMGQTGFT